MHFLPPLIAHLIVGVAALLWLLPLNHFFGFIQTLPPTVKRPDHMTMLIVAGLPVAYLIGASIDVFTLQGALKLRQAALGRFTGMTGASCAVTTRIIKASAKVSAEYQLQLSAQETVARGVALNCLLGSVVNFVLGKGGYASFPGWILLAHFVISVFVWMELYGRVEHFKLQR